MSGQVNRMYIINYIKHLAIFIFSGRTALVKARSVKVVLAALCTATMEEKYTCKLTLHSVNY